MLLKITHETQLSYSDLISESVTELRMTPRQEQDQHRLSFQLAIGPQTSVSSYFDWLGNTVHAFTIMPSHQRIRIVATSVIEIDREAFDPRELPDRWPLTGDQLDYRLYDFLRLGGPVCDCVRLHELAAVLNPKPGDNLGGLALGMVELLGERFTYQKGVTNAASPITEILEHGQGVCQDFTHLMIGLARVLNIPARYVSGIIHKDGDRLQGYTQTHAWCELFFPSTGWIGFDPANRVMIGRNFVKVAVGRDFRDVPPNRGVYRGKARESIEAFVRTEELPAIPPALAPERYESLVMETRAERPPAPRDQIAQQQEQQQQQKEPLKQQQHQQQQ